MCIRGGKKPDIIKDAGKSTEKMSYQDFKDVFQDQLPRRLEKVKVGDKDRVVIELLNYLNQKQSLFTMRAH